MVKLTLPDDANQFDAAVFTQSGDFVMCGHREECELKAQAIGGLYCYVINGKPVIRGDYDHESEDV